MPDDSPLLLEMRGIDKAYPGAHALRTVDLTLRAGEVLALLGENGAGKSTLIKVLAGAVAPESGDLFINEAPARIQSPQDSQRAGVAVIYQEFNLVPGLSARENIFLGQEKTRVGFLRHQEEWRHAKALFKKLEVTLDPETPCRQLAIAQQQIVEIAKALAANARILVMDEPTATLTPPDVDRLFSITRDLKKQGIGIIFISHRLEEIFQIADRVLVLRDGAKVGERLVGQVNRSQLIEMMVGRELKDEYPRRFCSLGEVRLEVKNLCRGRSVRDVSFTVRRGEVLGITGLVGAGRTETARLIFGADAREAGDITLDGIVLAIRDPRDAIQRGIGLLPEDRKLQGLILGQTSRENYALPNLSWLSRFFFVQGRRERASFSRFIAGLRIKLSHQDQPARLLSGGNQQKVVLAKWLAGNCEVLIFDEPTRGIDVGAKYEIYQLINQLAEQGKAVVFISSELPEVLGMADRILVMHEGRITGEIKEVARATQEQIMELAVG